MSFSSVRIWVCVAVSRRSRVAATVSVCVDRHVRVAFAGFEGAAVTDATGRAAATTAISGEAGRTMTTAALAASRPATAGARPPRCRRRCAAARIEDGAQASLEMVRPGQRERGRHGLRRGAEAPEDSEQVSGVDRRLRARANHELVARLLGLTAGAASQPLGERMKPVDGHRGLGHDEGEPVRPLHVRELVQKHDPPPLDGPEPRRAADEKKRARPPARRDRDGTSALSLSTTWRRTSSRRAAASRSASHSSIPKHRGVARRAGVPGQSPRRTAPRLRPRRPSRGRAGLAAKPKRGCAIARRAGRPRSAEAWR